MRVPDYLLPPPDPSRDSGLGLIDPISIISIAGKIGDTIHFLQYPKDKERRDSANQLLTRAAGGDIVAEAQLRLLSHVGTLADIQTMRAAGLDPGCTDPKQCGWATTWAQQYGQVLLKELAARRAAGVVGAELLQQSTLPNIIGATVQKAVTNPIVWVVGGAAIYFLFFRKRGR